MLSSSISIATMASLTPGVLSNLLQTATAKPFSSPPPFLSSHHRSPLLQVIEIVPCLSDNQWRSDGFFLKLSDSLHAAYVAVSAADDADLIRSDQIQLGQFVYIRGGLHVDKACPVPIVRGLKPVLKFRTRVCIGNPTDLVSSDLLVPFSHVSVSPMAKKKMTLNVGETRRLSLDSARRSCWDHSSPVTQRRDATLLLSSPRLKPKSVLIGKNLPKNVSPLKHVLSCESPALRNKNVVKHVSSPIPMAKSPKDGVKLLAKTVTPPVAALCKLPSSERTWSDQRIVWSGLPKAIQLVGKEVSLHRQVAASTAVNALEEASLMESVLLNLQAFGELCDSSKKLCAGQVVRRFLNIYHSIQNISKAVHLLLTQSRNNGSCRSAANKKATSWVQAAVVTGLSQFNLFKEPEKQDGVAYLQDHHHYIFIQNSSKEPTSPRNTAYKDVKPPCMTKHGSVSGRSNIEGKSGLKELESLADELVRFSSQWFLKYLESSLNKGLFFSAKKEVANGKESLLVNLKAVNRWLDDLNLTSTETTKRVEDLRKKLQQFLLEHIETAMRGTR